MSKSEISDGRLKLVDEYLESIDVLKFKFNYLKYTACYCEENIYMLCKEIKEKKPELLAFFSVIFISNANRSVPLWNQRAGKNDEHMVIWDYHVILLYENKGQSVVYDFDTLLPFPSPSDLYVMETFRPKLMLREEYQQHFRLVPINQYLEQFHSDRSHMLREDGTYSAEPPTYPPIQNGVSNNLDDYISMAESSTANEYGKVYPPFEFYDIIFK